MARKVIISCAVTGSIHTPSMSPHLPITSEQIVADALGAAEAGAAIIHLHARDPQDGRPSADPALFAEFMPRISAGCDAVLNVTTGGGMGMSMEQRLAAAQWARPELASMNMGSLNFNIAGAGARITAWKHAWEKPYLDGSADMLMSNTFGQIEHALGALRSLGTRFEFECYDIGHLYNLKHFFDRGLVTPPLFVQGVFGVLGGMAAELDHLLHFARTAERLFGQAAQLSALAAGRQQMPIITLSALLGGHVRVGLEDSLFAGAGKLAHSSAEQVRTIRTILEALGLQIATSGDAREMLELKGKAACSF